MAHEEYNFKGTYERYKLLTDDVARFLDDTARQIGFERSPPTDSPSRGKKNLKKGKKGKKQSRSRAKAKSSQYRVHLSEFVPIAEAIQNHKPPPDIEIPRWLMPAIEYTIRLRERVAGFYKPNGKMLDSRANKAYEKHQHFIETMMKVKDILGTLDHLMTKGTTQAEGERSRNHAEAESNVPISFEGLGISEGLELAFEMSRGEGTSSSTTTFVEDGDDDDREYREFWSSFFSIFCLFEDLNIIRDYLLKVWGSYKYREYGTDFLAASLVTNTAVDLVRRIDEQFKRDFPKFTNYYDVFCFYYDLVCTCRGINHEHRLQHDDPYNFEMIDLGEQIFLGAFILLSSFNSVMSQSHPRDIIITHRGYIGVFNPTADRSTMGPRERFDEDKKVLLEILPDFAVLATATREQADASEPYLDEISKGFKRMCLDRRIPLWLVFAAQVYLDITHALRDTIGTGFTDLQRAGMMARNALSTSLENMVPSVNWHHRNTLNFRTTIGMIDRWILSDYLKELKEAMLTQAGHSLSEFNPGDESYYLLRRHPLLCGIIGFGTTLLTREAGIALSTAWGSIVHPAHLYNALRRAGNLQLEWPDMEYFMSRHTDGMVFRGPRPTSKQSCLQRYNVMAGIYNRGRGLEWDKSSPVVQTFGDRYKDIYNTGRPGFTDRRMTWTIDDVERLIQAASPEEFPYPSPSMDSISVVTLLKALRNVMATESRDLKFDYLSMHARGLSILFHLNEQLRERFVQDFGTEYIERQDQIALVVGCILQAGFNNQIASENIGTGGGYQSEVFERAAGCLRQYIVEGGNVEINKMASAI